MPKKAKSTSFGGQKVTPAGKRHLESRAPKLRENPKTLLCLRGSKTSTSSTAALKSLALLLKPHSKVLDRKREDLKPFEDASSVEKLCASHDASLFAIASSSKKRPDNLVLGRLHDGHLLDAFEFGVVESGGPCEKLLGSKPCTVFVGDFDADPVTKRVKNFLQDLLRGPDIDRINLAGIDTVVVVGLREDTISLQPHRLRLKKGSGSLPDTRLEVSGPPLSLKMRRDHQPSLELWKASLKQPKGLKPKKRKNRSTTDLGEVHGRLHLGNQKVDELQSRKVKALKRSRDEDDDE